jgi:hypothetical protein
MPDDDVPSGKDEKEAGSENSEPAIEASLTNAETHNDPALMQRDDSFPLPTSPVSESFIQPVVDAELVSDSNSTNWPGAVWSTGAGGIAVGGDVDNLYVTHLHSAQVGGLGKQKLFFDSLHHRDKFIEDVLRQALQQSNLTFILSIFFTTFGGLIVLCAALLAITRFVGSPSHAIALVSGIAGALISTSGAAFSLRADRARKHLSRQAEIMQSQLMDEWRFTQALEVLAEIKDSQLSDQARVTLALRLIGDLSASETPDLSHLGPLNKKLKVRRNEGG